jgi:hypothetical protein
VARFYGYEPDPDGTDLIVSGLPMPTLAEAGPRLQASTKEALLYPALLQCSPDWRRGAQGIGSCVGWGWSYCCDVLAAVEIAIHGEREEWAGRVLEASVYAFSRCEARGVKHAGYQDGSYGAAAAIAVSQHGTLHYGIDYGDQRFEAYDPQREKTWGNTGVPNELEPYAKKRCVKTVTLVRNFDEAALAIQSGYPIAICSGQGFVMTRDDQGFCKTRGSWSHCMAFVGVRFDRPGLLCVNSWGDSNTGEHYPKNMPEAVKKCSFWVDADVATYMLRGGDSFALSSYDGFPPRKLPDWGFQGVL